VNYIHLSVAGFFDCNETSGSIKSRVFFLIVGLISAS
jgi:hypothetical protein